MNKDVTMGGYPWEGAATLVVFGMEVVTRFNGTSGVYRGIVKHGGFCKAAEMARADMSCGTPTHEVLIGSNMDLGTFFFF